MNKLLAEISMMKTQLQALVEKTEILINLVNGLDIANRKDQPKNIHISKDVKRKILKSSLSKGSRISSATAFALQIIKRHKNGINVATLKKKAGFDDKKISNIVHRACKKGLIKRAGRGIYVCDS